ncbi:CRISPR system precrRNA processing endoribonuclease RAMP protein Cas6 [uncultured Campylobacter sp.]|uniref:CRISPR system precrRNA processing endoribonuclease RAMP protein Cas6 n=1 Tax=uncultured Campylobacter sp. TaxID=218934 RepID=UPI00262ECEEA|nr:CRISPR system precrRNA processing endoribonuclease RAMP protein Cas6 [uncultured Campylobacter sp.]
MLKYLELGVCDIDLKPSHPFVGSTIRGTFGYALRRVSCPYIGANCEKCDISGECVYNEFFENVSDTPNFRLDINLNQKSFDFKILLFEHAARYLPHVAIAIVNMQEIGLEVSRRKFKFSNFTLNGEIVEPKFLLSNKPEPLNFTPDFTAGDYEISLLTPLRMKQKNTLVRRDIDFKSFIRQIAMRFENITREPMDKFEVKFDRFEQDLRFYDLNRYSNRQHTKMQFGGVLGRMRVFGLDERSAKLLQLAKITGVGKSTVFGLGKIKAERI